MGQLLCCHCCYQHLLHCMLVLYLCLGLFVFVFFLCVLVFIFVLSKLACRKCKWQVFLHFLNLFVICRKCKYPSTTTRKTKVHLFCNHVRVNIEVFCLKRDEGSIKNYNIPFLGKLWSRPLVEYKICGSH